MIEKIIILDINSLPEEIIKGIEQGLYKIYNGVVRDIDTKAIIKHIPQKILEIDSQDLQNLPELIKKSSQLAAGATALSTVVILGAIVVATKIIVNKLNEIQNTLVDIKKELQDQNLFQYFLQLRNYIAISESLRELLKSPALIEENRDLIVMKLNALSIERNALMLTMHERLKSINNVSPEHKEILINFIDQSVALLPKIAYIEQEAAYAIEKFYLGDRIYSEFSDKYSHVEYRYKKFLNVEIDKSKKGESNLAYEVIQNVKKSAAAEFELNKMLLDKKYIEI